MWAMLMMIDDDDDDDKTCSYMYKSSGWRQLNDSDENVTSPRFKAESTDNWTKALNRN